MLASAFEILGPIMVGPSSSHTAGALRLALVARSLVPEEPASVEFTLYNSFFRTHEGHGTDRALVAGMLGFAPDDVRVRSSFSLAGEAGLDFSIVEGGDRGDLHPNTVEIRMRTHAGADVSVMGESVGGGRVRISSVNGVRVSIEGELPTVFVIHKDRPGVIGALASTLGREHINIATMRTFRDERGGRAYTVFEMDDAPGKLLLSKLRDIEHVVSVSLVDVPGVSPAPADPKLGDGFSDGAGLLAACGSQGSSIGGAMRSREGALRQLSEADEMMRQVLAAMRDEVEATIERPECSLGGLLDGQARLVADGGGSPAGQLMGPALTQATAYAMAVLERSANMGVIVAAPTAGSAGVVPGSLLALAEHRDASEENVISGLWAAAAVGAIVAENASVSGAEGGCQAEVGTASAMAAAGICEMLGAEPATCLDAASIAITNMLGLVCDPVRGLVEHPCQMRNAAGVAVAYSAAQLALSGVASPIPFDEVVAAMRDVGSSLPASLRETALGGLAAAPSACGACQGCA